MDIYYVKNGAKIGPVTSQQLKSLAMSGEIGPETRVLAGDKELSAKRIKGLEFGAPAPDIPPVDLPPVDEAAGVYGVSAPEPVQAPAEIPSDPVPPPASIPFPAAPRRRDMSKQPEYKSLKSVCGFLRVFAAIVMCVGLFAFLSGLIQLFSGGVNASSLGILSSAVAACLVGGIGAWFAEFGRYFMARDREE